MENASKALIIAGAILISILIIAIGMYIYTSSTGSVNEAIAQMGQQEVKAFNSQWSNYEGVQNGSQVKSMLSEMISQATVYQDEPAKVLAIDASSIDTDSITAYQEDLTLETSKVNNTTTSIEAYVTLLNNLYTKIKPKKKYMITFDFAGTALIRKVTISDA